MAEVQVAAILVGLNSQRDDRGGGGVVAASVEVDGSGDHAHDQPRLTCDPSCFDLALRSETLTVDKRLWTNGAMDVALSIRRGVVRDIFWWYPKIDSPSYALPRCRLQLPYGVHPFRVEPLRCQELLEILEDPSRWSEGFFSMGGTTWPGYGTYPYVHARFHISALQEKKTIRVQGYANVCLLLQTEPPIRRLVEEVRCVLGLPALSLHLSNAGPTRCSSHVASPSERFISFGKTRRSKLLSVGTVMLRISKKCPRGQTT